MMVVTAMEWRVKVRNAIRPSQMLKMEPLCIAIPLRISTGFVGENGSDFWSSAFFFERCGSGPSNAIYS